MNAHRLSRFLAGATLALMSYAVPAFDIYQLPMFATGAATPNVMLLVDTSGSMDNVTWADGFNLSVTYPSWGFTTDEGNYQLSNFSTSNCSGSEGAGRSLTRTRSGVTKTLCVPAPQGTSTRYLGNYLNYLFETYANNTNLTNGQIPYKTRMQVAKEVAADLVGSVTGVRFGVARFATDDEGAVISQGCDDPSTSHIDDVKNAIAGYDAVSNTPLAEALYEITRYFRGLGSYYHSGTFTSPIQYRCQKNFTIAITDGFPTRDTNFPSADSDPADAADSTRALPNWDGLAPATTSGQYPLFPQYSDGFKPSGGSADEGYTLLMDDIAKFGFDIDMKTTGNDQDGVSYNDSEFPKQSMSTYTVGFATSSQMLEDAADYSDGQYFTAKNAADLKDALQDVLLDIQNKATAAASVSQNSTRLDANFLLYQARFDSTDWSGDLQAYPVDDTTGAVQAKVWSANEHVPVFGSRTIVTQKSSPRSGIAATWANLTTGQQDALKLVTDLPKCSTCSCNKKGCKTDCSKCSGATTTAYGAEVLDYLLGVRSGEEQNGGDFRDRSTLLGDIINSDPLFVGKPDFGYQTLPGTEGSTYVAYRTGSPYAGRPPMVYVGANDGMLHAIDASKAVADGGGKERFAYIPLTVFPNLKKLTSTTYSHQFYVNGSAQAGDAYINGGWKTVLVGTLGAGGRGVFALDVTDPTNFGPTKVLWEKAVTDDTNVAVTDDADLGFTYGQASIGRMKNGKWAAVVANGYHKANPTNNHAVLFIIDLADGTVLKKIDTGVGTEALPNGLSTPVIVDVNGDKIVDYIYAGDMRGNMWKFDVTDTDASNWNVAYVSGGVNTPLYTAQAPDGTVQPITAKPEVTRRPDGDLMVLFGTGKYFEEVDRRVVATPTPQVQTFYAVRDPGATIGSGRSTLQQQSVIATVDAYGRTLRVTTNVKPTATQNGWYMDLPTAGERQVSGAVLRTGRVIFTTVIPNSDACHAGGTSWLMEVNALTGSRLDLSPYDLDNDGKFTETVTVTVTIDGQPQTIEVPATGLGSDVGIEGKSGIAQKRDKEYKYLSGSTGGISVTIEPGDIGAGRQSWRQLQ